MTVICRQMLEIAIIILILIFIDVGRDADFQEEQLNIMYC